MTMTWETFAIRLLIGFFLAVGIGIERQWLKTREVFKINVLVTLGSAMFVMLSIMTPGDASPTRISAQIVSGVGFLGGGVILREGTGVRGINTAATLWCAAAIGTLVGSGFLVQGYIGTLAVVGSNLLLRPLVETFKFKNRRNEHQELEDNPLSPDNLQKSDLDFSLATINQINRQANSSADKLDLPEISLSQTQQCSFHIVCFPEGKAKVFELLVKFVKERKLTLVAMESKNVLSETKLGELEVEIKLNFNFQGDQLDLLDSEEIIRLLKTEVQVSSINWQFSAV
jgi:putative Mg2+ transporter-C (MgtC) family protein